MAVLSPSSGLAARFPRPYELGLRRLWEEFGLNPAVFPTTTAAAASPAERAADVMAAFAEPGGRRLPAAGRQVPGAGRRLRRRGAVPRDLRGASAGQLYVYRVLMCMGERRLLRRFAAIVWARPKAWSHDQRNDAAAKARYTRDQHEAVLAAVAEYHPGGAAGVRGGLRAHRAAARHSQRGRRHGRRREAGDLGDLLTVSRPADRDRLPT